MVNKNYLLNYLSENPEKLNAVVNSFGIDFLYNEKKINKGYTNRKVNSKIFEDIENYLTFYPTFTMNPETNADWENVVNILCKAQEIGSYLGALKLKEISNQICELIVSDTKPEFMFLNSGSFQYEVWSKKVINEFCKLMDNNKKTFFLASSGVKVENDSDNLMVKTLFKYIKEDRGKFFVLKERPELHFVSFTYKKHGNNYFVKGTFQTYHSEDTKERDCHEFDDARSYYILLGHFLKEIISQGNELKKTSALEEVFKA